MSTELKLQTFLGYNKRHAIEIKPVHSGERLLMLICFLSKLTSARNSATPIADTIANYFSKQ